MKYINDKVNYKIQSKSLQLILEHYDSNKKEADKEKDYYSQYSALGQNKNGVKPNIVIRSHMKK